MTEIIIPERYWKGNQTIENEIPWLTPKSIYRLDELLKKDFNVLEIGSGGSTLFYSRRCKTVTSIETDPPWYDAMKSILPNKHVSNCNLNLCETIEEILEMIDKFDNKFNCIMVDPHKKEVKTKRIINRDTIFSAIIKKVDKKGIIVLDNYTSKFFCTYLRYRTNEQIIQEFLSDDWVAEDYNDRKWHGSGTKILHNLNND